MACEIADFIELVHQLDDVTQHDRERWSAFDVGRQDFGYLWPRTRTVGFEQTLSEQLALVAERPDVFEVQFTASGSAGSSCAWRSRPGRALRADAWRPGGSPRRRRWWRRGADRLPD